MSHKTILVIDDDPVMCELTQEVLEDAGFAAAAMDIEEARAAFSDNPYRFDLILIDHFLSGTRGEEHATDFLCLPACRHTHSPLYRYRYFSRRGAFERHLCRYRETTHQK
jgi:CheY-like chemotaxis protein